jgi:hypothetical protein
MRDSTFQGAPKRLHFLRWHYPDQVAGIISARQLLQLPSTPCTYAKVYIIIRKESLWGAKTFFV